MRITTQMDSVYTCFKKGVIIMNDQVPTLTYPPGRRPNFDPEQMSYKNHLSMPEGKI